MTALTELQTRIAAFDQACVIFYGAACFAFSAEGATLEMLRPAFERAQAAEAAMRVGVDRPETKTAEGVSQ